MTVSPTATWKCEELLQHGRFDLITTRACMMTKQPRGSVSRVSTLRAAGGKVARRLPPFWGGHHTRTPRTHFVDIAANSSCHQRRPHHRRAPPDSVRAVHLARPSQPRPCQMRSVPGRGGGASGRQQVRRPALRGSALRCVLVRTHETFTKGRSIFSRSTENGPAFP